MSRTSKNVCKIFLVMDKKKRQAYNIASLPEGEFLENRKTYFSFL